MSAIFSKRHDKFADAHSKVEARDAEVEVALLANTPLPLTTGLLEDKLPHELFAELRTWRSTGALALSSGSLRKIIYFHNGTPVGARSNQLSECLGRLLVREGIITEAECQESVRRVKATRRQQGSILVEMGCMSPYTLQYALSLQAKTKIIDAFQLTEGRFHFLPRPTIDLSQTPLSTTSAQILYEGIKTHYSSEQAAHELRPYELMIVWPAKSLLSSMQVLSVTPNEKKLLHAIDGRRSIAGLRSMGILEAEQAEKLLLVAFSLGMIELKDTRAEAWSPPRVQTLPPLPPISQSEPKVDSPARQTSSAERRIREQLSQTLSSLASKNHYEVLGVPLNAGKGDIESAFMKLARQFHPDRVGATASTEVRNLAQQVYARLSLAHDTLSDVEERNTYARALAAEAQKAMTNEVGRIMAAEGYFQRGEGLMRKRDYAAARREFQQAVALCPDEGEYQSALGFSTFNVSPYESSNAQDSLRILERAVALNPKLDHAYVYRGIVQKIMGFLADAQGSFERALAINPNNTAALRELRLLGHRRSANTMA